MKLRSGARHPRREILDRRDVVAQLQDLREQRRQVEPFPRRSLERSIVEIEAVQLDEGAHRCPPQKARASEEIPRPAVETARGVLTTYETYPVSQFEPSMLRCNLSRQRFVCGG